MSERTVHTALRMALPAVAAMLWAGGACCQTAPARSDGTVASIARAIKDSNQLYLGWRAYQQNCARCHGSDATGTDKAPNLLERVKPMSETRFIGTVLQRYKWVLPAAEASTEGAAPAALIQGIAERQQGVLQMPAWENEPAVKAHVADLYDYLRARASGALAPGRPSWHPGK